MLFELVLVGVFLLPTLQVKKVKPRHTVKITLKLGTKIIVKVPG